MHVWKYGYENTGNVQKIQKSKIQLLISPTCMMTKCKLSQCHLLRSVPLTAAPMYQTLTHWLRFPSAPHLPTTSILIFRHAKALFSKNAPRVTLLLPTWVSIQHQGKLYILGSICSHKSQVCLKCSCGGGSYRGHSEVKMSSSQWSYVFTMGLARLYLFINYSNCPWMWDK